MQNIIEQLLAHENTQVDEYNSIVDQCEELDAENVRLKKAINLSDKVTATQHEALKVNEANLNTLNKTIALQRITVDGLKNSDALLQTARKELATLKEQVKRTKAASLSKDARIKQLEKKAPVATKVNAYGKDGYLQNIELGWFFVVFASEAEYLHIYPHVLTIKHYDGTISEQYTLLYTDRTGNYITATLNNDVVEWGNQLRFPEGTPERTIALANKFTLKPSDQVCEYALNWLTRVNVIQGGRLKEYDTRTTNLGSELVDEKG